MSGFRFESWPWLFAIPFVLIACWFGARTSSQRAAIFSSLHGLESIPKSWAQRLKPMVQAMMALGMVLVTMALARPQLGKSESRIFGEGIAIELVLDISGSMEALDFVWNDEQVDRITAVRNVVQEFVLGQRSKGLSGRPNDLIGVVAFGGFADSKCPLTLDHGAVVDIIKGLDVPKAIRDRQGRIINEKTLNDELATAIGDGIALGVDRLKDTKAKSKVMVLLTDGDNTAGAIEPAEAASIAKELGIKIYTIGVGRDGVVPVPREDEFGRKVLLQGRFRIDEKLLKEIADETGGAYFHASDSEGLASVYSKIDQLEKSEFEERKFSEYTELYRWFAGIGLGLIFLARVLLDTRLRTLP
jgi:Ca-activated chloride channel homolog